MRKIGFIGLGIMGKPMAKNLLKAGYPLTVYDIVPDKAEEVVEAGAKAGSSSKDVAEKSEIVITMLPNSPEVKEAVLGKNGVLEGAKPGTILIDMSSIAPLASKEVAEKAKEKGVTVLDAPVSGGEPKAIKGTLAIMVGGPQETFDEVDNTGGRGWQRQHDEISQSDHRCSEHCRNVGGNGAGSQSRRQRREGLPGDSRGTGGQHCFGCEDAAGAGRQLQAGIPHRAAHQGPGQRIGYRP